MLEISSLDVIVVVVFLLERELRKS